MIFNRSAEKVTIPTPDIGSPICPDVFRHIATAIGLARGTILGKPATCTEIAFPIGGSGRNRDLVRVRDWDETNETKVRRPNERAITALRDAAMPLVDTAMQDGILEHTGVRMTTMFLRINSQGLRDPRLFSAWHVDGDPVKKTTGTRVKWRGASMTNAIGTDFGSGEVEGELAVSYRRQIGWTSRKVNVENYRRLNELTAAAVASDTLEMAPAPTSRVVGFDNRHLHRTNPDVLTQTWEPGEPRIFARAQQQLK